ncbi:uncharacterized protein LOC112268671 [Brachypodium distachyon]|uniref:uncharacterized protein LOC112268671 n=1 Tax=Brachypodium distachyon TaxID=15368 RepID=UPI0001C70DBC|nr:uncharacterized protein LOC112268671 [Brachypodium distachyon]|eukprot:XP_024310366.1 uncharacterized protein LOC112268671 [Brachypodium distachyon]
MSSSASEIRGLELLREGIAYLDQQAKIRKFVFQCGLEPAETFQLSSFKEMYHGARAVISTYESILQEQLKETELRAKEHKEEWLTSGCSVILDCWKSENGEKIFVSVLVHCSKGLLFLKSMDISTMINDVDDLASMLSKVVDDVGARHIVQVVTTDVSSHMQAAQHAVLKKYDHLFFFTVCADHCINLLLGKIAALEHSSEVLTKAREITGFIYGHKPPNELIKGYIQGCNILSSYRLEFVAKFITLDRLVSERENLVKMFSLPECYSASWDSSSLTDDEFWSAAADVLKVTNPFVNVLFKLEADNCPMGILYEAMDTAKEEIPCNLRAKYDYWDLVDKIWDDYLHTQLHAAGHFLNPRLLHKDLSSDDPEISSGIAACITRMAKGHYDPSIVKAQIEVYKTKLDSFDSDSAIQEMMEKPQVGWWLAHGTDTPELQTFAVRILSQTCYGVSRFNFNRRISEKLHGALSYAEKETLRGLEYAHYNLRLAIDVPRIGG